MQRQLSPLLLSLLTTASIIGHTASAQAEQPCRAYTRDTNDMGYGYEEINNCPFIKYGTFQNRDWEVFVGAWEPAAYIYRGKNRHDGRSVDLMDFDVSGTTRRPQYSFHNKNVTYRVTYQAADPDTIRLEVFQNSNRILNQLLSRTSSEFRYR